MYVVNITPLEALILISLNSSIKDEKVLVEDTVKSLRCLVREAEAKENGSLAEPLPFSLTELQNVEKNLPVYGSYDEASYAPLRIKIHSELSRIESEEIVLNLLGEIEGILTFGEVQNASTGESTSKTKNNATRKAVTRSVQKNQPGHPMSHTKRTNRKKDRSDINGILQENS